ncbi:alpha/beta hydrolase [Bacillaceae bacterium W0354]
MQIKKPETFTFEAGDRAVLLLHGFTGNSADVRMLGRFLEKKGYTCHAPIYEGHGEEPEKLIDSDADQWWQDALQGYEHLQRLGYEEIAVAGLSLGGVLSLKLAINKPVKGVIPICAPVFFDNVEELSKGFKHFASEYKQLEQKDDEQIGQEVHELMENSRHMFQTLNKLIKDVHSQIEYIYAPTLVLQAEEDEMINMDSANYIYEKVQSDQKDIIWYEGAPHVITLSDYKDQVHEDVFQFLQSLDWSK